MRVLEIKEFKYPDKDTLKNRKSLIEKELNLKEVKYTSKFNEEKNCYL